jgi:hypothetical protein
MTSFLSLPQANPLRMIHRQPFQNQYLHPGCKLRIVLHKSNPINAFVDNAAVSDRNYYYDDTLLAAHGGARDQSEELFLELTEMYMTYESLTINDEVRRATFAKICSTMVFDKPYMLREAIPPGVVKHTARFPLEPGTRFVVLAIMSAHQIKHDSRPGNFMAARYILMDTMDKVTFSLTGVNGLVLGEGLEKCGTGNGNECTVSVSMFMLHQELFRQGLTNKRFEDWAAPAEGLALGAYETLIPADLSPYLKYISDDKQTNLTVDITFDAPGSRPNFFAVLFGVQQILYSYKGAGGWKSQLILN